MSITKDKVYSYQDQDFTAIRNECLEEGCLFEDKYFKLDNTHTWLRPPEITGNPQLFVGEIARFDTVQGELGDCWMLASISALGRYPNLVMRIIPPDQSFTDQYAGVFHFYIWRFGIWYDVVIDDRLPTRDGQLVYTKSVKNNAFWTALLEKAYCKIFGGEYKVVEGGNLCEALEDFTGGIVEQFFLDSLPNNFENILVKSMNRNSLAGVYMNVTPGQNDETPQGLVKGHSYSVTDAKQITLPEYGKIVLVRIRNPWGNFEWRGPWSDNSPEWNSVPNSTKQELGLVFEDDGEFWMCYSDFVSYFQFLDMCHLAPDAFIDARGKASIVEATWNLDYVKGNWVRGVSAGGIRNLYENPQICFTLGQADSDDNEGLCYVIISLMQFKSKDYYYVIGFRIYKLTDPRNESLGPDFFVTNEPVADIPMTKTREASGRFKLEPGAYCVVPYTALTGNECEFLIRIYSENGTKMNEMDNAIVFASTDAMVSDNYVMKTKTTSFDVKKSVDGLKKKFDSLSGADGEVNWSELKIALDSAVKNPSKGDKSGGWFSTIYHKASSIIHSIFGKSETPKRDAFETIGPDGFSNDVCRSMVALLDVDHSGKLNFNEFQDLWTEIQKWKSHYELYSDNTDGFLTSSGLKVALQAAGFNLNKKIFSDIVHRYSTKDEKVSFEDFFNCVIKIKIIVDIYKSKAKHDSDKVEFTLDEFLDRTLYS